MPQFQVDDEVAELIERLAKEKPFEYLSFNDALRRIFAKQLRNPGSASQSASDLEPLSANDIVKPSAGFRKTPSPSAIEWASRIPELKGMQELNTWQAVCAHLKIDRGGDSARRKLKNWVKDNRPDWPEVPTLEGDA